MKKLLTFGTLLALTAVVAACGSSGGSDESATTAPSGGGTVSVANVGDAGRVLVDSHGRALYASDQENAAGMVLCTGGSCTSIWKPLTVSGGAPKGGPVAAELGDMKRPDGSRQVTYDGKLLYTFTQDGSGEVTGNGVKDAFDGEHFTWHVVTAGNGGGAAPSSSGRSGGYGY
jgi:predicted lipoprotein with Yx(FWY)xxD motif